VSALIGLHRRIVTRVRASALWLSPGLLAR
jgi:hypothetical protein